MANEKWTFSRLGEYSRQTMYTHETGVEVYSTFERVRGVEVKRWDVRHASRVGSQGGGLTLKEAKESAQPLIDELRAQRVDK